MTPVQCTIRTEFTVCTLYTVQCTACTVWTLYSKHSVQYEHCTLKTVYSMNPVRLYMCTQYWLLFTYWRSERQHQLYILPHTHYILPCIKDHLKQNSHSSKMFMISSKILPITSFKLKQDTRLLELFSCTRYIVILLGYICCIKRAHWMWVIQTGRYNGMHIQCILYRLGSCYI